MGASYVGACIRDVRVRVTLCYIARRIFPAKVFRPVMQLVRVGNLIIKRSAFFRGSSRPGEGTQRIKIQKLPARQGSL
jgi:hypothetical protein